MPRRNWPHRLAKKRKKHRAHRMKRRTPAQRRLNKGREDRNGYAPAPPGHVDG